MAAIKSLHKMNSMEKQKPQNNKVVGQRGLYREIEDERNRLIKKRL